MPALSVVIITYNEAENIRRCLAAAAKVADEILVVDSFSEDDTVKIANKMGARVIKHVFEGHIQQKNYAKDQAAHDYVLSLDADEVLSGALIESILQVKKNWSADGYYVNRLNNYAGQWIRHGAWYPDRKLRLWDRRKGRWGGENPHDEFMLEPGASAKKISGDLLHYSVTSIDEHLEQINKFSTIRATQWKARGKKPSIVMMLARPAMRFMRDYLLKGGFLDGFYGYVIAKNSAHAIFLRYAKLRELYRLEKTENSQA